MISSWINKLTIISIFLILDSWITPLFSLPKKTEKPDFTDLLENLGRSVRRNQRFSSHDWIALNDAEQKKEIQDNSTTFAQLMVFKSLMLIQADLPYAAFDNTLTSLISLKASSEETRNRLWKLLVINLDRYVESYMVEALDKSGLLNDKKQMIDDSLIYYLALIAISSKNFKKATDLLLKVPEDNPKWLEARFHLGLLTYKDGEPKKAALILRTLLADSENKIILETSNSQNQLSDQIHLTLGRIYFELKDMAKASYHYRKVNRAGPFFPDALQEQSWVLFSAANPLYSIGSLHSYFSPFFGTTFDPESHLLQALSYFWICRYGDSAQIVKDFYATDMEEVVTLRRFMENEKNFSSDAQNYDLISRYLQGDTLESEGLSRNLMQAFLTDDLPRSKTNQLAQLSKEKTLLTEKGVLGRQVGTTLLNRLYEQEINRKKIELGKVFALRLKQVKLKSEDIVNQFALLKVELLMSQKEQIGGKELHSEEKFEGGADKTTDTLWANAPQSWTGIKGQEYWWDEIGFYISNVQSQCAKGDQQ